MKVTLHVRLSEAGYRWHATREFDLPFAPSPDVLVSAAPLLNPKKPKMVFYDADKADFEVFLGVVADATTAELRAAGWTVAREPQGA